jgi:hypothetical protein
MDLTKWNDNLAYQSAKTTIDSLQIVNDTTERGVKLMEDFNEKFTKNFPWVGSLEGRQFFFAPGRKISKCGTAISYMVNATSEILLQSPVN